MILCHGEHARTRRALASPSRLLAATLLCDGPCRLPEQTRADILANQGGNQKSAHGYHPSGLSSVRAAFSVTR